MPVAYVCFEKSISYVYEVTKFIDVSSKPLAFKQKKKKKTRKTSVNAKTNGLYISRPYLFLACDKKEIEKTFIGTNHVSYIHFYV